MRWFSLLFAHFLFFSPAWAYDFTPKSPAQVSKEAKRWSLSQWMEQKGKIQWMDLWLNSNSKAPNWYEFYVGGEYSKYDRKSVGTLTPLLDDEFKTSSAHLGFFISIIGLHGRYEKSSHEDRTVWDALAQLRLLGSSDQGSNLTALYGVRNMEFMGDEVMNQQFGGQLTLYLLNAWAVQGRYLQWKATSSDQGNLVDGYRFEGSTWVEWGAVRVFGTYYHEPTEWSNALGTMRSTREGVNLGLRFYLDFKK